MNKNQPREIQTQQTAELVRVFNKARQLQLEMARVKMQSSEHDLQRMRIRLNKLERRVLDLERLVSKLQS